MHSYLRIVLACCAVLASTAAIPLAAQDCPSAPLFDLSGPVCTEDRQKSQCGCSECFVWDASAGAEWYEIRRCNAAGEECTITGDTRSKNRPGYRVTVWCAAWDAPFPALGLPYDYAVRACKDGPTGPICATGLSNAVRYVTAPYLCIADGLEVVCATGGAFAGGDTDGDGITDALDLDDDGDGVPDTTDNCPQQVNVGQRDADADGIGDACDPEPRSANPGGADTDRDGVADRIDVCPSTYDPAQADADGDRSGNACDNCPQTFNDRQDDADADGQGDRCDVDDGLITMVWSSKVRSIWDLEGGSPTWAVYRGDLAELRRSLTYTQAPGANPLAAQWCGTTTAQRDDPTIPPAGTAAFYLVGAGAGNVGTGLGRNGAGAVRANTRPCP